MQTRHEMFPNCSPSYPVHAALQCPKKDKDSFRLRGYRFCLAMQHANLGHKSATHEKNPTATVMPG